MNGQYQGIFELLRDKVGLNADALGDKAIGQILEAGMHATGIVDEAQYAARLRGDPLALQTFVEQILVPESWFFRQQHVYDALVKLFWVRLREQKMTRKIRILSAGCSTGEEPYSIVISLLRAGVSSDFFEVVAIDLSHHHLVVAKRALYSDFSFRETSADVRNLYFHEQNGEWQLRPNVRDAVQFRHASLTDPYFLADEAAFDIIFCRNVLIYLVPNARKTAIKNMAKVLRENGVLIVGQAESNELKPMDWIQAEPLSAGIFKKVQTGVKPEEQFIEGTVEPLLNAEIEEHKQAGNFRRSGLQRRMSRSLNVLPNNSTDAANTRNDCWNTIGVWGNQHCLQLAQEVHCQNCPVFVRAGRVFLSGQPPEGYLAEWSDRLSAPPEERGDDLASILVFQLRQEWLGWPVTSLIEVTNPKPFHRIPHRGGILEGILNIRGELHLAVRMEDLLNLSDGSKETQITGSSRLIVLGRNHDENWAFMADEIDRVWRFPKKELTKLPLTVSQKSTRFTRGLLRWEGRSAGLLDEDRVFEALSVAIQ